MISPKFFPDRKVLAGGIGGIVTWLALMALEHFFGVVVSSDVAGIIVAAVAPTIAYLVPPSVMDIAKRLDTDLRSAFVERDIFKE